MNCVCPECGSSVSKGYLSKHLQTEKCRVLAAQNSKFRYVCRDCNIPVEKLSQTHNHICGVLYVVPELVELRAKNQVLEQVLAALGINLNPLPTPLPRVEVVWSERSDSKTPEDSETPDVKSSESSAGETSENPSPSQPSEPSDHSGEEMLAVLAEYINQPDTGVESKEVRVTSGPRVRAKPAVPRVVPRERMSRETTSQLEVNQHEVVQTLNDLLEGKLNSPEGEDNYYLLGSKLGELTARFTQNPSGVTKTIGSVQKLKLGSCSRAQYLSFISGLKDSGCSHTAFNCVLMVLGLYRDLYPEWRPDQLVTTPTPANLQEICSLFQLPFTFLPLEQFVQIIKTVYVKTYTSKISEKKEKGSRMFQDSQYYRKEGEKWVLDPFLQDLTQYLSGQVVEKSTAVFRGLYKNCFGDNIYRRDWYKAPAIEAYRVTFKNIEICSTVFDLFLLIDAHLSVLSTVPCKEKVSMNALDQFQLLSTRVHLGAPAYELSNFYERVFDEDTQGHLVEDAVKWHGKYLKGVKAHSSKFALHKRFRAQVEEELRDVKN